MSDLADDKQENHHDLVASINILKNALPKMTHLAIPPTPENYAVWYQYSQGSILQLNSKIDELISHQNPFSPSLNHQLYVDYVAPKSTEMLENAHQDTELLIRNLMGKIQNMHSGTSHFSGELEHFQDILSTHPDIETLSTLVADLLDETDKVTRSNDAMKDSLAKMGEKVIDLKQNMATLNQAVLTDPLTGIANRRAFDETLTQYFEDRTTSAQQNKPANKGYCLLMLDIDYFKKFNDTFGHAVGDKVLVYVANAISNAIKGDDFVARFGGEEFVILLPNTDYKGGLAVAEHIRVKVGGQKLAVNKGETNIGHVPVSIGVALMNDSDYALSFIERADKALYHAKNNGRNQVIGEQQLK
ncbi:MAG: diguanylate cyclase [Phenylobacterium sp.]